jgi:hypothetical protein
VTTKRTVVVVILAMAFGAAAAIGVHRWWSARRLGDLSANDAARALVNEREPFDAQVWRSGDLGRRGAMLAGLARRHRFVGGHRDVVVEVLGKSECYVGYEDEPCYRLQFDDGVVELQFPVNHSTQPGTVLAARLRRPGALY